MGSRALVVLAFVLVSCGDDESSGLTSRRTAGSSGSSGDTGSSGSGGSSGSSGVSATGSTANELCFNTINEYRKTKGLPPYARWAASESCADSEAESDGKTNSPHGAFPKCGEFAQNECPGTPGSPEEAIPRCLDLMWSQGPGEGHYDNMASTKWKEVACGVYVTGGGVWSVQNFR